MYAYDNPYGAPQAPIQSPPAASWGRAHAYVPLGWRSVVAAMFVLSTCAMSFALDGVSLAFADQMKGDDPSLAASLIVGGTGLALILAHILAAIFFGIWVNRASKNLPALGRSGMTFTPGWCVGWFFVPFANLVKPVQAVSEVWRASDPQSTSGPFDWMASPRAAILSVWWAAWIIGNVIANVSARIDDVSISGSIGLVGSVVTAVAGIACVLVMRGISSRQSQAAARMGIGAT